MVKKKEVENKLEGIGGWLILPTIGLFLTGAGCLFILLIFIIYLILGEISRIDLSLYLFSIILIFLIVFTLYFEFKHKRRFPRWAIITIWFAFISKILLSVIEKDYDSIYVDIILGLISATIWTAYFIKSKRVKNTFKK